MGVIMTKYWNFTQKNIVSPLKVTGAVYLAGFLMNLLGVYGIGIIDGPISTSVFPLASIVSLLAVAMFWIINGPIDLKKHFTLAISMSSTRKNYLLMELFQSVFCVLILYAFCFLLFRLEDRVLIPLCFSGVPREPEAALFTVLFREFSIGIFWVLAFMGVSFGIRLLLGSLLIRFGRILFWILWGIWMCVACFFSSLDMTLLSYLERKISYAATLLDGRFLPLLFCAAGIIISCIGILLLKKQDIRSV